MTTSSDSGPKIGVAGLPGTIGLVLIWGAIFFVLGLSIGMWSMYISIQREAVIHGAAEWRTDPNTGIPEFKWKPR